MERGNVKPCRKTRSLSCRNKKNPVCSVLNLRIGVRSYELRLQNTPKPTAEIIRMPGLAPCLYVPLAARDLNAIEKFLGRIVRPLARLNKSLLVESYEPEPPILALQYRPRRERRFSTTGTKCGFTWTTRLTGAHTGRTWLPSGSRDSTPSHRCYLPLSVATLGHQSTVMPPFADPSGNRNGTDPISDGTYAGRERESLEL
jgi:hypothetical protein